MASYPGQTPPFMPPPAGPRFPGPPWLQKIAGGFNKFMGAGSPQSPYLSAQEQQQAQQQQRMAMTAALLQGAGPRPQGTSSPLGAVGAAMQAGQQASSEFTDQALRAKLLQAQMARATSPQQLIGSASPADFTPDSLSKYQKSGDPKDLEPVDKSMFGRFQPRDYTPDSLAKFNITHDPGDLRRIAPYQAQNLPGGGIGAFNPITGQMDQTPVSNQDAQKQASELSRAKAEATASGEATGKATGAILTKAMNAANIKDILAMAEPLIDEATGSGTGAGRDALGAFFGVSTSGAQAIAQLKPLQAAIMLNQPRMEGPQSDKDVQLYREAAGQIGDPSVPGPTKKAALKTISALQDKYAERGGAKTSTGAPAVGDVLDGYRYKGGDPGDQRSWEPL